MFRLTSSLGPPTKTHIKNSVPSAAGVDGDAKVLPVIFYGLDESPRAIWSRIREKRREPKHM